ncbi:hypothetical protein PVK06_029992 [Gossypium arboreum]|uniref:Uncharacterized protein n=1 Tax=Gossypium arboreum TaxID=29729 RepID=A0ABR0NPI8_GOSAR|nr:hypothetical protein PVK06_029992 [Gossypium arboreum]
MEEVMHDVPISDDENLYIIIDHDELEDKVQQEFEIDDYKNELNMTEGVSEPINIEVDVTVDVDVEVELTTNLELQPVVSESVGESVHFLVSFSFDYGGKS